MLFIDNLDEANLSNLVSVSYFRFLTQIPYFFGLLNSLLDYCFYCIHAGKKQSKSTLTSCHYHLLVIIQRIVGSICSPIYVKIHRKNKWLWIPHMAYVIFLVWLRCAAGRVSLRIVQTAWLLWPAFSLRSVRWGWEGKDY